MDAMKDALMKRRMMKAKAEEMSDIPTQDVSLAEGQHGLMGSEEESKLHDKDSTDLAPDLEHAGNDQHEAEMKLQSMGHDQGDAHPDELANLEKMFEGGRDLKNRGFMGKAANLMKDRLASLKK